MALLYGWLPLSSPNRGFVSPPSIWSGKLQSIIMLLHEHHEVFACAPELLWVGDAEHVLLLFGGKKLPEMMKGMGQGVKEFKKGMHEVSEPIEDVKEAIKEATELTSPEQATTTSNAPEQQ
jgi:sec-independent protein translocase protein TatA